VCGSTTSFSQFHPGASIPTAGPALGPTCSIGIIVVATSVLDGRSRSTWRAWSSLADSTSRIDDTESLSVSMPLPASSIFDDRLGPVTIFFLPSIEAPVSPIRNFPAL